MLIVVLVALSTVALSPARALEQTVSCDTNCNDRCMVDLGLLGKHIEPGCKHSCEIHKAASCKINLPVPDPVPPPPGNAACSALVFDNLNGAVIAACSNWDGRLDDQHSIDRAVQRTIQLGVLTPSDYAGVQIRWCNLITGEGVAPRHSRVYLHTDMKAAPFNELVALVAHELFHIKQYREMGDARFGCEYSREYVRCGRCQDRNNALERPAYEFGDRVMNMLASSPPPPPPLPPPPAARTCVVGPNAWCWLSQPGTVGGACWCPAPYGGFFSGVAR
jgi:hypothetical protein